MSAKLSTTNIKSIVLILLILIGATGSPVVAGDTDSIMLDTANGSPYKYDNRIHRYRKGWSALIPSHVKLQYAGNMGLMSAGFGWDYGKRSQWETDIYLGFMPKYESSSAKMTFTVRQIYIPWSVQIRHGDFSIQPLTCGLYFNTVFSSKFWFRAPEHYPSGYYGFNPKVRTNIFLGQAVTYDIAKQKRFIAKQMSLFYELSTCDLYLISAATNRYLKPKDYLSLSFGIKLQLL